MNNQAEMNKHAIDFQYAKRYMTAGMESHDVEIRKSAYQMAAIVNYKDAPTKLQIELGLLDENVAIRYYSLLLAYKRPDIEPELISMCENIKIVVRRHSPRGQEDSTPAIWLEGVGELQGCAIHMQGRQRMTATEIEDRMHSNSAFDRTIAMRASRDVDVPISVLVKGLCDKDMGVQMTALYAVTNKNIALKTIETWVFNGSDRNSLREAAMLASTQRKVPIDWIERCLKCEKEEVNAMAHRACKHTYITDEVLERWLQHGNANVRDAAMSLCNTQQTITTATAERWITASSWRVRRATMTVNQTTIPTAIVKQAMTDESWRVREAAVHACRLRTDIPLDDIKQMMNDKNSRVSNAALQLCLYYEAI